MSAGEDPQAVGCQEPISNSWAVSILVARMTAGARLYAELLQDRGHMRLDGRLGSEKETESCHGVQGGPAWS